MPIYQLLKSHSFDPEDITILTGAFEAALQDLGLKDRSDPMTQLVARRIMDLAKKGERDPARLRAGGVTAGR